MSGQMQSGRITVVVPTCNRPELLARCLTALAAAEPLPAGWSSEVVVTDDGQVEVEAGLRDRFPAVVWVRGPCLGPAANRNNGVRHGSGEWIAFTDDDCVPDPGWLSAYVAGIEPGVELYEGPTTCRAGLRGFCEDAPINLKGGSLPSCNLFLSRRLFAEMGGFDEKFLRDAMMEDVDFRTRLWEGGRPWRFVPGAIVDHPPRRRIMGRRLGVRWENTIYYWAKRPGPRPFGNSLPIFIAKVRLVEMVEQHRVRDYPAALASLAGEWWHVLRHWKGWEQKYAGVTAALFGEGVHVRERADAIGRA